MEILDTKKPKNSMNHQPSEKHSTRLDIKSLKVVRPNREDSGQTSWEFNINFPCNGIYFIYGPSGYGKSTFLEALMGQIPHTGSIEVNTDNISSLDFHTRLQLISYVPAINPSLCLPLKEVINKNLFLRLQERIFGDIKKKFESISLNDLNNMQRKLVYCLTVLQRKGKIILLDEPIGGMDSKIP